VAELHLERGEGERCGRARGAAGVGGAIGAGLAGAGRARLDLKVRGRRGDRRGDDVGADAHARALDFGAGGGKQVARRRMFDLDAGLGEDAEGRMMDLATVVAVPHLKARTGHCTYLLHYWITRAAADGIAGESLHQG
jgi:hypothetical protein